MKKGLAVFSGSAVVHKMLQDGTVVLGTSANPAVATISGSLTVTGSSTLEGDVNVTASKVKFSAVTPLTSSNLADSLVELYNKGASETSALSSSVSSSLASLSGAFDTRVDSLEGTVQAIIGENTLLSDITGTLNSIKEIAEYLDGDGQPAQLVSDLSTEVHRISGALEQEIADRGTAVSNLSSSVSTSLGSLSSSVSTSLGNLSSSVSSSIAGVQSDLNSAQFTVNGLSVNAKGGSFTVVTGSSNNLTITNSGSVVSVDLNSSVTLAGTLSANVLSASAGLSVAGGATVTTGDLAVSHGTIKTVLEGTADATALTALAAAAATSNGKFFYLVGEHASFPRANCWYFCQDGVWFDAPFFFVP